MSEESEGIIATLTKIIEQNWRLLLVGVIILAIALNSSWSNKKPFAENQSSATPTAQTEQSGQTEQNKPAETQNADNSANSNTAQAKEPEAANTNTNTNTITEVAAKSEGVTHLARRAVKGYLQANEQSLTAEQKIYAEDFLKKKIGSRLLEVGEKVEFSSDLIKQSVEQAKGLNQKQIENLSKYVPLVKNLN